MLRIERFEFNPFGENTYLVWNEVTRDAVVIDPGMMIEAEWLEFTERVTSLTLTLRHVLLTHCHLDHTASARRVATAYGIDVMAHPLDRPLAQALQAQAERFGFNRRYFTFEPLEIDTELHDGDEVTLGSETLTVIHTPGHSPGGVSFYLPSTATVFTGDSLFAGSVGRCDLPGGDMSTLLTSVTTRLYTLPDATVVLPGHGPASDIATERASNPYTMQ